MFIKAGLAIVWGSLKKIIFLGQAGILVLINLKTGIYRLGRIKDHSGLSLIIENNISVKTGQHCSCIWRGK